MVYHVDLAGCISLRDFLFMQNPLNFIGRLGNDMPDGFWG